jgi:hypothetical protein
MTQYVIKILLTTALIVAVTEVSKRNTLIGGVLASFPLISFIAMLWLYFDTKDSERVAALSSNTFWLVIPSLVFFVTFPLLVKAKLSFPISFSAATILMLLAYLGMIGILKEGGSKL